jgi:hypothetical protein
VPVTLINELIVCRKRITFRNELFNDLTERLNRRRTDLDQLIPLLTLDAIDNARPTPFRLPAKLFQGFSGAGAHAWVSVAKSRHQRGD